MTFKYLKFYLVWSSKELLRNNIRLDHNFNFYLKRSSFKASSSATTTATQLVHLVFIVDHMSNDKYDWKRI